MYTELPEFYLPTLIYGNVGNYVLILGRRQTGRSWLIRDILWQTAQEVLSLDVHSCMHDFYISTGMVFHSVHDKLRYIHMVGELQYDVKLSLRLDKLVEGATSYQTIVWDDCFCKATEKQKTIICNLKQQNNLIISSQSYPLGSNNQKPDYLFLFCETRMPVMKKIWNNYISSNFWDLDFNMFYELVQQLNSYECLVFDLNTDDKSWRQRILRYKALGEPPLHEYIVK